MLMNYQHYVTTLRFHMYPQRFLYVSYLPFIDSGSSGQNPSNTIFESILGLDDGVC